MKRVLLISKIIGLALALGGNAARAGGKVSIDVQLNPVGNFTASADTVKGSAVKKGEEVIAKNITLNIDDLKSGVELRDDHMNKEYFESKKYPTATISVAKGKGGKFIANMLLRGKKNKISGTYTISGSTLTAKFKSKLSDWEIKKAAYMGVGVVDEVDVAVEIPVE
jgi:hypothetical protein